MYMYNHSTMLKNYGMKHKWYCKYFGIHTKFHYSPKNMCNAKVILQPRIIKSNEFKIINTFFDHPSIYCWFN